MSELNPGDIVTIPPVNIWWDGVKHNLTTATGMIVHHPVGTGYWVCVEVHPNILVSGLNWSAVSVILRASK